VNYRPYLTIIDYGDWTPRWKIAYWIDIDGFKPGFRISKNFIHPYLNNVMRPCLNVVAYVDIYNPFVKTLLLSCMTTDKSNLIPGDLYLVWRCPGKFSWPDCEPHFTLRKFNQKYLFKDGDVKCWVNMKNIDWSKQWLLHLI
jgi:hypothetical protein